METMETSEKKLSVTVESLAPILQLSKLEIRAALAHIGGDWFVDNNETLPRSGVLSLLLVDTLSRTGFLQSPQVAEIHRHVVAMNIESVLHVVFADRRWCGWTGYTGWLDLTTGDHVEQTPTVAVETIGYNLVALYDRAINELCKRARIHAKQHQPDSVDE